jgi:hypothetical protein
VCGICERGILGVNKIMGGGEMTVDTSSPLIDKTDYMEEYVQCDWCDSLFLYKTVKTNRHGSGSANACVTENVYGRVAINAL